MYRDSRTEEDYEEDERSALDYAIKLIDVDKMPVSDAVAKAAHRYEIPVKDLMYLVGTELGA